MENRELDELFKGALEEEMSFRGQQRQWRQVESRLEESTSKRRWILTGFFLVGVLLIGTVYGLVGTLNNTLSETTFLEDQKETELISQGRSINNELSSTNTRNVDGGNNIEASVFSDKLIDRQRIVQEVAVTEITNLSSSDGQQNRPTIAEDYSHLNNKYAPVEEKIFDKLTLVADGESLLREAYMDAENADRMPAERVVVSLVKNEENQVKEAPKKTRLTASIARLALPFLQSNVIAQTQLRSLVTTKIDRHKPLRWRITAGSQHSDVFDRNVQDSTKWSWHAGLLWRMSNNWQTVLRYTGERIDRTVTESPSGYQLPLVDGPSGLSPNRTSIQYQNHRVQLGVGYENFPLRNFGGSIQTGLQMTKRGTLSADYEYIEIYGPVRLSEDFPASNWYLSDVFVNNNLIWKASNRWSLQLTYGFFIPLAKNEIRWKKRTELLLGLGYDF